MTGVLTALDLASVFVFALTGALAASRAQLDIVGFLFLAGLTAVGGGTLRDLILDRTVFWIGTPWLLGVSSAAAVIVYFGAHRLESRLTWLTWLDAMALPIAVAAGFAVTRDLGHGPVVVAVMSVATGTFGGLMRDVVANEVPLVLKQGELYATAAFAGAIAGIGVAALGLPAPWPALVAALACFALRAGSLAFGWKLNAYRPRPPRPR